MKKACFAWVYRWNLIAFDGDGRYVLTEWEAMISPSL